MKTINSLILYIKSCSTSREGLQIVNKVRRLIPHPSWRCWFWCRSSPTRSSVDVLSNDWDVSTRDTWCCAFEEHDLGCMQDRPPPFFFGEKTFWNDEGRTYQFGIVPTRSSHPFFSKKGNDPSCYIPPTGKLVAWPVVLIALTAQHLR